MTAVLPILLCLLPAAFAEPETAVDAGRKALSRRWRYPWYDAQTDSMRRIDVREEAPPRERSDRGSLPLGEMLQWFGWAAIGLLLAMIVWLMLVAWRAHRGDAAGSRDPPGACAGSNHVEALPLPADSTGVRLLDEAWRWSEQGDFSRAVVYLFAHELLELDRLQIIRLARGKTNRQYMGEVGRRTALRHLVEQTMVAFEDVFFGNRLIDRARFQACWSRLGEFEALTRGGAA